MSIIEKLSGESADEVIEKRIVEYKDVRHKTWNQTFLRETLKKNKEASTASKTKCRTRIEQSKD